MHKTRLSCEETELAPKDNVLASNAIMVQRSNQNQCAGSAGSIDDCPGKMRRALVVNTRGH
jgi:hypothetical protein